MRTALACIALLALPMGVAAQGVGPSSIDTIKVSPRLPTTLDPLRVTVTGLATCGGHAFEPPQIEGSRIVLTVHSNSNCSPPIRAPFAEEFTLAPLPAGTWTIEAVVDPDSELEATAQKTLEVDPATTELFFHDHEFRVRVEWSTPDGALHGNAYGVPLSKESGYLWFFQGSNPEIMVKILDGRPVNGHWWVFISSNTSLEFKVRVGQFVDVVDPFFYQEKVYVSPAGANKNFIDTTTFGDL